MFSGNGSASLMGLARVSRHPQTYNKHLYPIGNPLMRPRAFMGRVIRYITPKAEFLAPYHSERASTAQGRGSYQIVLDCGGMRASRWGRGISNRAEFPPVPDKRHFQPFLRLLPTSSQEWDVRWRVRELPESAGTLRISPDFLPESGRVSCESRRIGQGNTRN